MVTPMKKALQEKVLAFFTGDIFSTLVVAPFVKNAVLTIILGVLGGAAGLLGKDLYKWIKKEFLQWRAHIKAKRKP